MMTIQLIKTEKRINKMVGGGGRVTSKAVRAAFGRSQTAKYNLSPESIFFKASKLVYFFGSMRSRR